MAQKKKASQVTPEVASAEDIASRLSSARELIGTTEAEAEQKREQTRAQMRETAESAQARQSESERQRSEAAEAAKTVAERKLAALSYAETYRERMQSERAKARKAKQAEEAKAREEEEARQREERQARIEEMLRREQEELDARNARAEEMLRSIREKSEETVQSAPEAAPEEVPAPQPEAPVAEEPKAPTEEPKETTPTPNALDKFKTGEEGSAREIADEPLTFDLSDLGLEGHEEVAESDDDIVVVDEDGNPIGDVADDYTPAYPPYGMPHPYHTMQQQQNSELSRVLGEMSAEREASRIRAAEADARQAEVQRRSIEMMIAQENTRAEREERIHRENAEREERFERERAEREERIARENRESLAGTLGDMTRRAESVGRGEGDARDEAFAREVATSPVLPESVVNGEQEPVLTVNTDGADIPPMITVGGVTYEEEAEHQKVLSKAERRMNRELRKQAKKEAMGFIKRKRKENKELRREIKELRRLARQDKSRLSECLAEELNIRLQIVENLAAMVDYAKEFKKNTLARELREALKEEIGAYNRACKKTGKLDNVDAEPIEKSYIKSVWARESVEQLPRARVIFLPESAEGADVSAPAAEEIEEDTVDIRRAIKKQTGVADSALVALEKAVSRVCRKTKALEKAQKKGKKVEKPEDALREAYAELEVCEGDADAAINELGELYDIATSSVTSLVKRARFEKTKAKVISKYETKKSKIMSKLPSPPDGGGDTPLADEDSVNFPDDTNGAAENAEGVRITTVALPTTRDNMSESTEENVSSNDTESEAAAASAPVSETDTPAVVPEEQSPETQQAVPQQETVSQVAENAVADEPQAQEESHPKKQKVSDVLAQIRALKRENNSASDRILYAEGAYRKSNKTERDGVWYYATALNEHAYIIENLGTIILLAKGADLKKEKNGAISQMASQIRTYNHNAKAIRHLGYTAVCDIPTDLPKTTLHSGDAVTVARITVEDKNDGDVLTRTSAAISDGNDANVIVLALPADESTRQATATEATPNTEVALASPISVAAARERATAQGESVETVITTPRQAQQAQGVTPVEEHQNANAPVTPKQSRDELALAQFDAYNERLVARAAGKADRIDRKGAQKQLVALQKETVTLRAKVISAKNETASLKKKKKNITDAAIAELNARAALIENLSRVAILAHALGEGKVESSAVSEMNSEVRAYNTGIVYLPAEHRSHIAKLESTLSSDVINNGTPASIAQIRHEEVEEEPFEMIPSANATTASALAGVVSATAPRESSEEQVLTTPLSRTEAPAAVQNAGGVAEESTTSEECAPEEPKPSRDELALAALDARNEQLVLRSLTKADKAERKTAQKQLDILVKQTDTLRHKVVDAKAETAKAKKKKEPTTPLIATELCERATLIEHLAKIVVLAKALGANRVLNKTNAELSAEVKAYNTAVRALPKADRKSVSELPSSLASDVLNNGTVPSIARVRMQEPEEEITIIPTTPERGESALASALIATGAASAASEVLLAPRMSAPVSPAVTSAVDTPVTEEPSAESVDAVDRDALMIENYTAYNDQLLLRQANKAGRAERRAVTKQLAALQKESEAQRHKVASAKAEVLSKKKRKEPTDEAVVLELSERATQIELLAKVAILAGALGQTKQKNKALTAINTEVRMYNAAVRTLPKAQRKVVGELSRDLSIRVGRGEMPALSRVRIAEPEEEIVILPVHEQTESPLAAALALTASTPLVGDVMLTSAPRASAAPKAPTSAETQAPRAEESPVGEARPSADDIALESFTAYNEQLYQRENARTEAANRKVAQKQLTTLQRECATQRKKASSAKAQLHDAKKRKEPTEQLVVDELCERATLITTLSKVILLAGALGQKKAQKKAIKEVNDEVRLYNATVRTLPKAQRRAIGELSRNLSGEVVAQGTIPSIPLVHIDRSNDPIEIISTETTPDPVAVALAQTAAVAVAPELVFSPASPARAGATAVVSEPAVASAPESAAAPKASRRTVADERAFMQYTERQEAQFTRSLDKTARADRKAAQKQLTELQKQVPALRRAISVAEADSRAAKKQKAPITPTATAELNARASLIENLSRTLILANALGNKKSVGKVTRMLKAETRAYNATVRTLPRKERRAISELDTRYAEQVLANGNILPITRVRVDESNSEITILPSPATQMGLRNALASATATVTPEEFYIPSALSVASTSARLSRKEAQKQIRALERQNAELSRRLANAEAARVSATKKKESTTPALVASLNTRAAIIEGNARILALAKGAGLTKIQKNATRAIDSAVREYNAKAKVLAKNERVKIAPLDEKLSSSILSGVPMASISRIRLDRVEVNTDEFITPVPVAGVNADIVITPRDNAPMIPLTSPTASTALASERTAPLYTTSTVAFDNKKVEEYLTKQQKQIAALKKERTKEERRTSSLDGNARVASILRARNTTARIIAVQIDTIEILRDTPVFRREMAKYKTELANETRHYNKLGDMYKKLTGKKLTPIKSNLSDLVSRGMPYEAPKIAQFSEETVSVPTVTLLSSTEYGLATEPVYENLSARPRAVARAERRARTQEYLRDEAASRQASEISAYESVEAVAQATRTTVTRDYLHIEQLDRYEYRSYIKEGEKEIRKLQKQIGEYEKQNKKATQDDTHAALVGAILGLRREICEVYFRIIKTGVSVGATAEAKKYAKFARREIETYNREIKTLTKYSGMKYPRADVSAPDKILKKKSYNPLPTVACQLDPTTALRAESELLARQRTSDARQKRIDAALGKKRRVKAERETREVQKALNKAPLSAREVKKFEEVDLAVISARYEEERLTLVREIAEFERQYTLNPAKAKAEIRKRKYLMKQLEHEKSAALTAQKRDNKRYYAILTLSPKKLASGKMSAEDAAEYQADLLELMKERAALNDRILALYRGVDSGSDSITLKLEKIYLNAYKRSSRKQEGLTRRIRRLNITVPQKEQLFQLINERARLEGQLAKEKQKLSLFKLRGKARKAQKIEIRKVEVALKKTKYEIERKMRIRVATDKRYVSPESVALWFFALLALCIVAFMVYVFRAPLWALIESLINPLMSGNITGG